MSRFLHQKIRVKTKQMGNFEGELIDWDENTITIQYKIDDAPTLQLMNIPKKICIIEIDNPENKKINMEQSWEF